MRLLGSPSIPVPPGPPAAEAAGRLGRLATMVLGPSLASVTVAARPPALAAHRPSPLEQALVTSVIESGDWLVIDDARQDPGFAAGREPARVRAWAGFPVRDPDGIVVGALCVTDRLPRRWSPAEVDFLKTLAHIAAGEFALALALRHGAESAALARTLRESLLPSQLPRIPGLQVAARHVAGGSGAEVLGDFYDVFPSVRGNWGMAVGDVCGKGAPAAKSTALARYTLRAEAHRQARPSLILAALNRALLDWLTDDPRFLTAIYASARPTPAGACVRISSAGHPLALVRRADGCVRTFGRPGTSLRPGDSLILFTDGVTEARGKADRELYGDDRLREVVAALGARSAAQAADAIQQAVLAYSGGEASDDMVTLVLQAS
jgi:sigma-B regulation protein RsbU (phosphoserine phosphatase)